MSQSQSQQEGSFVSTNRRGPPQETLPDAPQPAEKTPPYPPDADESSLQADLEMVRAVLNGERQAQKAFVLRFSPILRKVVFRTLRHFGATWTDMLEDLLQDAFYDLLKPGSSALANWQPEKKRSLKNYLCSFFRWRTVDRLRRSRSPQYEPPIPEEAISRYLGGDVTVLKRIEDRSLINHIEQRLSENFSARDMRIFELSFFENAATTEIAEELGISSELVFTVRYRLRQTLLAMQDELLFGEPQG